MYILEGQKLNAHLQASMASIYSVPNDIENCVMLLFKYENIWWCTVTLP